MKDLKKLIQIILKKGYLMSLGTADKNGPWVSDVIYVYDEKFNLYWLSETKTRHSKAVAVNSKVAATITLSNSRGEKNVGLQIEGKAKKIKGDILALAKQHRLKRGKKSPKKVGEILDEGESWYCLQPTKIEVIYEPFWGFEKNTLKLAE